MDLWDLTRLLLRRWYFAVPMLLASVTAVVITAQTISPDYKSTGYMQLIPPPSAGKPQDPDAKPRPANPWLDLGYNALGNAAALTITDPTALERLADEGFTDSVTVVLNDRTPLFEIEAVGNSKDQAAGTVRRVIKLLQDDIGVKQKQYGALAEDTISTLIINDGSAPEQDSGKVKRVLIVAAGVGVLLTTALTIALDYWLRRRSHRKAGEAEDGGEIPAVPEPAPAGKADAAGPPNAGKTEAGEPARAALLESAEKTRVLRPTRPEPAPRQSAHANGNVYSGERRSPESAAHGPVVHPTNGSRNGAGDTEPPLDATIVLPTSHPMRRSTDKRP